MDKRNGSFREMKKMIVFKNEQKQKRTIENCSNDLDRS